MYISGCIYNKFSVCKLPDDCLKDNNNSNKSLEGGFKSDDKFDIDDKSSDSF